MPLRQRIIPSRRDYNRWVADQTLEDYALRFTAVGARRWSAGRVANTALGATSFLALEAIGGGITLRYGFANAAAAILCVGLLIFLTALPITIAAARHGLDIDLLTRGAGFGYLGSTVTSLIYSAFTFLFFAIEASILAAALQICLGIPPRIGYVIAAIAVIPMVTHGIAFISRFQRWTQPVWITLNLLPFLALAARGNLPLGQWVAFGGNAGRFTLLSFGACASVVVSLIAQVGEQVDFLRFIPPPEPNRRWRWWLAVIGAGPGWILPGLVKMFAGSFLAWLAVRSGLTASLAVQPTVMYRTAFAAVLPGAAALAAAGIFVALSQLKINVTNAYAGSIAWSNFFSRLTRSHPGRVVWVVFNVVIALLLMENGLYRGLEGVLSLFSVLACAWVGALVADLVVVKPLGLAPAVFEFKRAHLYDVNPVGVGATILALAIGGLAAAGDLGPMARATAPFASLAVAFLATPLIAWATGGRFYLARRPRRNWNDTAAGRACIVCGNRFEPQDTAFCPAYGGVICSLCCTLDARCADTCKPHGRVGAELRAIFGGLVPPRLRTHLSGPLFRFTIISFIWAALIGAILLMIFLEAAATGAADRALLAGAMWRAFFVLVIIASVAAWLLVLAQETRHQAEEETRRQTRLLLSEIAAHRRTDAKLQKAKEAAESANLAKTRFVVTISHELRTPLNAVLGYAQLLERDGAIPAHRREALRTILRSGEHMAGLIEGLLDISKIEAGRIRIERREVRLDDLLGSLVDMFRLQAAAKGIDFAFQRPDDLPAAVHTDETRLRQILINLLSNAVKFTRSGGVSLRVSRRGDMTDFEIADTGPGIPATDLDRIFEPFERIERPAVPVPVPGVGLGLTIARLLTEILGGEITVRSKPGVGSVFRVRLLLSSVARPSLPGAPRRRIQGYAGRRRTIVVADDDAAHRTLLDEVLSPIGFDVVTVPDAAGCLRIAPECRPDAFILDLSMPEMDGWQLARSLRETAAQEAAILVVSAHPDDPTARFGERPLHDAFLPKPISLHGLIETLGRLLRLEWVEMAPRTSDPAAPDHVPDALLPHLDELARLAAIGHLSALRARLSTLAAEAPAIGSYAARVQEAASGFRLDELASLLRPPCRDAA